MIIQGDAKLAFNAICAMDEVKIQKDKTMEYLYAMTPFLNPREIKILQLRRVDGRSLDEVAKYFDITSQRIRQLEAGAEEKLNNLMNTGTICPK